MKRTLVRVSLGLSLVLVGSVLSASELTAQNWKAAPLYGTVELSAGFTPDPVTRALKAGGSSPNPIAGDACAGYINADAPDYDLNYTSGYASLYVYARSDSDVTLLVNDPNGAWHCSDDWDGTDPMISFQAPVSGNYNVWVGTYDEGAMQDATLYFTELEPSMERDVELPDIAAMPLYETIELTTGFMPDPLTRALRAGGGDANTVSGAGCGGYINAAAPDFDLNFTSGSLPLYIWATADADLTLLVNDANGAWHCSDDVNGTDPVIHLPNPPSGNYNIWVGTYSEGETQDATLYISERAPS